jgi:hypothetical protein
MADDSSGPDWRARLLRCMACGRTVECRPHDVDRHLRDGWPRCCREMMTLFVEEERPTGRRTGES